MRGRIGLISLVASSAVLAAVSSGEITPDEAGRVMALGEQCAVSLGPAVLQIAQSIAPRHSVNRWARGVTVQSRGNATG